MSGVVIDASLVAAQLFPTRRYPEAQLLFDRVSNDLRAPVVLRQEFYNAVHRGVRRGLIQPPDGLGILSEFESLPIAYYDSPSWIPRAYAMAQRHRQPGIFDAIYYACAEDLGAELWTCDQRFVRSMGAARPDWLRLCPDDV